MYSTSLRNFSLTMVCNSALSQSWLTIIGNCSLLGRKLKNLYKNNKIQENWGNRINFSNSSRTACGRLQAMTSTGIGCDQTAIFCRPCRPILARGWLNLMFNSSICLYCSTTSVSALSACFPNFL